MTILRSFEIGKALEREPRAAWWIVVLGGSRIPYYNARGDSIRWKDPLQGVDGQMTRPQSKFGKSDTAPEARRVQYEGSQMGDAPA